MNGGYAARVQEGWEPLHPWPRDPVAVVGLGVSGRAIAQYLMRHGAAVTGFDTGFAPEDAVRQPDLAQLAAQGARLVLGAEALSALLGFETVFVTPGMPKEHPALQRARAEGARLTGEVPFVLTRSRVPVIGITGSAGKTTTTTLVGDMLAAAAIPTFVGGNIGRPAVHALDTAQDARWLLLELSSFQLDLCRVSPTVGALLNLAPNHLDVHPSFEAYRRAKLEILAHQGRDDQAVTSADTPVLGADTAGRAERRWRFGLDPAGVSNGVTVTDGYAVWRDGVRERRLWPVEALRLLGRHNLANALAASLLACLAGASAEAIEAAVRGFQGVPHRLELVYEAHGIRYVDDSIATAPDRTLAALAAVEGPVVLIAGGSDKGLDFRPLGEALRRRVRVLLTMGPTGPAIAAASRAAGGPEAIPCADLADAVRQAKRLARPGDTVLLAPAAASFDQFPNYAARGDAFRRLVREDEETSAASP